ncbi:hypothetical protein L218DRAFT_966372 [Marasmius fiardii PR-910]|nr:hypothetical protein L218DRAFT_966372 [Marasmius fiardii PR-910]
MPGTATTSIRLVIPVVTLVTMVLQVNLIMKDQAQITPMMRETLAMIHMKELGSLRSNLLLLRKGNGLMIPLPDLEKSYFLQHLVQ